jgi:hypothetical protein
MELLETQDPEKRKLIETSQRHRREMERELKSISEKTERVLKNALIIGGVLALTYVVVNQLTSSKTKKAKKNDQTESHSTEESIDASPSMLTKMGDKAMSIATMFLLDLAKEKLSEYLQRRKLEDENT